ncbi:hypothetical protein [Modestobacter roseus]|uniref:Uncharacterized protein n=1 Tax=Modestobacter roseus TaxID=1181884 RepID=A0A562IWG3_9ACTN|nr:hypothetical protein [Modestobacter roseus]MQA33496.1 hypothetical protein [Modestobacter roseus]TWH74914.1 hypothetical protein JD78_03460 [Modestobacter roseus]
MARVSNRTEQGWRDDLLMRLRMRDVPGARIGEVLAEVQSHVAETGEHPQEAFGPPKEYADRVADAIGAPPSQGWRDAVRGVSWRDWATTVVIGVSSFLLADSLWALGAGGTSVLGLPAWLVFLLAATALGASVTRIVRSFRADVSGARVTDPRTGADMVPLPRWAVAVLVGIPLVLLLGTLAAGLLTR